MITNAQITRYMALNKKARAKTLPITEKSEFLELKEIYVNSLATNPKRNITDADMQRINELNKKYKSTGLSSEEEVEFVTLRLAMVIAMKGNVQAQVNNIDIVNKDGSVENLGEKFGSKLN